MFEHKHVRPILQIRVAEFLDLGKTKEKP